MVALRPGFLVSLSLILAAPGVTFGQSPAPGPNPAPNPALPGAPQDLIPQAPSAPPRLSREVPTEMFSCQRQFMWKGKLLDCDSELTRDGENLRPILAEVPAAEELLDDYQSTRRSVRKLGYVSAVGVAMLVSGFFISRGVEDPATQVKVRNYMMGGGLLLSTGSLFYGLGVLKTNEAKLGEAVKIYNDARPSTPIELRFTTGFTF